MRGARSRFVTLDPVIVVERDYGVRQCGCGIAECTQETDQMPLLGERSLPAARDEILDLGPEPRAGRGRRAPSAFEPAAKLREAPRAKTEPERRDCEQARRHRVQPPADDECRYGSDADAPERIPPSARETRRHGQHPPPCRACAVRQAAAEKSACVSVALTGASFRDVRRFAPAAVGFVVPVALTHSSRSDSRRRARSARGRPCRAARASCAGGGCARRRCVPRRRRRRPRRDRAAGCACTRARRGS